MWKPSIILIIALLLYLLINDQFQSDFLNKTYILCTFSNISLPFHEVRLIEGSPWAVLLNHKQIFDVNQNLLARALKNVSLPSSVFFHLCASNKQGIFCFHKSDGTYLCYFYHVCFIQRWLLGWFLRLSKFDWFLWVSHSTLRYTFNSLCWSIVIWIKFRWLSTLNKL